MNNGNVQLAWALIAGRLAHISEFRNVPRDSRPTAVCEGCGFEVIMKIGHVRSHHYSHRAGTHCPLTAPETARHYNTKHLLASKLRSADKLSVVIKCGYSSSSFRCTSDLTALAAQEWDEVRVEPYMNPIRPDILLARAGVTMLAIEVRASHAVPDEKAELLFKLGIPWVEVAAGAECDEWTPGAAMPVLRYDAEVAPKFCASHSNSQSIHRAPENDLTRAAATRTRTINRTSPDTDLQNHGDPCRFRVVDCYPAEGPRVRRVFWIYCTRLRARTCRLRLVDGSTSFVVGEVRAATKSDEALRKVHDLLIRHLRDSYERYHSSQRWLDGSLFPKNRVTVYRKDYMAMQYRRDSSGAWTKIDPAAGRLTSGCS